MIAREWHRNLLVKNWFISPVSVTLCDPMDCSPPGSSVLGIFKARILEWAAIPFSRTSSQPRDWTRVPYVSCTGSRVLYHWATCIQKANSLEKNLMLGKIEGRRRRGWQRLRWMDGITDSMDMSLSKLRGIVKDSLGCCSAWHCQELDPTEKLNTTTWQAQ